ncbi:hypothetical protein [Aquisalinus flavus]|nr:hypothetical protein [Aquisalinus flavus]MBD0425347.1 hypothetical protein [Aquisalinus flavus]UNE49002.1 hypothetical protein FF099_13565 [Aquisalinus flavus]
MIRLFIFLVIATFAAGHAEAEEVTSQDSVAQEERYAAADVDLDAPQATTSRAARPGQDGVARYETPSSMRYEISGRDVNYSDQSPVSADGAPTNLRPASWIE